MSDKPGTKIRRSFIGEALVRDGVITEQQLQRALRVQALLEQPRQLGEVLMELGYATKRTISDAIMRHGRTMRLGDMLIEQGLISESDLEAALSLQKEEGIRIGQALINLGAINERVLLQNLARQSGIPYIEPMFAMIEPALLTGVAPEYLERNEFVPFSRNDQGIVTVVVSELGVSPTQQAIEELYKFGHALALGPKEAIQQTIADYRKFRAERNAPGGRTIEAAEDAVVKLVDHILTQAIEERASDIHIEPMSEKVRLRYRIDGVLVYKTDLPKDVLNKVISRIKVMAECNIAEHQRHQGGRILFRIGHREYDLRLSVYVTVHGECAVLRILNKQMGLVSLDELGMNPTMLERFRMDVLDLPTGVVLITGPTGSGKTTTLYSAIDYCNSIDTKVITAEDPVEYMIDGIIQCSIYEKVERTFESTLREIVRQDPDIIVLGEVRDRITADTAIQAALTGHKVYSTFHTEDTIGALLRLMDMQIETFLIASTVIAVLGQRLVRRICPQCVAPYMPGPRELRQVGLEPSEVRAYDLKKGRGCKQCNYTGYRGRLGVYELLILNDAVKEAILRKLPAHEIRRISMETTNLVSMREDAVAKVVRGFTTFEETLQNTPRTFALRPLHHILKLTQ